MSALSIEVIRQVGKRLQVLMSALSVGIIRQVG